MRQSSKRQCPLFLLFCFLLLGLLVLIASCGGGGGGGSAPPPLQTTASPASGIYDTAQSVTLRANRAATIYYSLDGNVPSIGGANTFSGPSPITNIQVQNDTNLLQFFAVEPSGNQEAVKSATYVINGGASSGPDDPLHYYPLSPGDMWRTQVTTTETTDMGVFIDTYADVISVTSTTVIKGATAAIMRETNPENTGISREDHIIKSTNGIVLAGYRDQFDTFSSQLIPYTLYLFSSQTGSSFVAFNKTGLDYGQDLDFDGRTERADMSAVITMKGLEPVTVPAGTYAACVKIEVHLLVTVYLSSTGQAVSVSSTQTEWYAPGIGEVKNVILTAGEGYGSETTEELIGYIVGGHGSGIRTEVTPSAPQIIRTGGTVSFTASVFDIYNAPITDVSVTWHSSNTAVAAIDANGVATGMSPGAATITAKAGDVESNPVQMTVLKTAFFGAPATFGVQGTSEHFVTAGDLNGDGKLDLAVANSGADTVSVLLGDGLGSFSAPASFVTGSVPRSVAIADLNGDSKQDLAVVNYESFSDFYVRPGSVSVLFGTGTGSFSAAVTYPLHGWEYSVAVGDFNKDTYPDLAVSSGTFGTTYGTIDILWNDGSGSFSAPTTTAYQGGSMSTLGCVSAADLDGDSDIDLAFTDIEGRSVGVLLNSGAGSFGSAAIYAVDGQASCVVVGDLNNDGKPDLAVSNSYTGSSVSVLLGTGGGSFAPAVNHNVGGNPDAVVIADFNGDGKPDIAVANFSSSNVSILLGSGTGYFTAAYHITVEGYPTSLAAGDLNGDGRPDLAVGSHQTSNISVLLNTTP